MCGESKGEVANLDDTLSRPSVTGLLEASWIAREANESSCLSSWAASASACCVTTFESERGCSAAAEVLATRSRMVCPAEADNLLAASATAAGVEDAAADTRFAASVRAAEAELCGSS